MKGLLADSKKFFGNFPGCYFCGDRRPMVVIEEHQDTENRLQGNRITITRNNRVHASFIIETDDSMENNQNTILENGRINWKLLYNNILDKLLQIFAIVIGICIYVIMSYAWCFYEYLFENYILGNDVEYKAETHPAIMFINGILGIAVTVTIVVFIWCCLCCCWDGNCSYIRQQSTEVSEENSQGNSRRSSARVVSV